MWFSKSPYLSPITLGVFSHFHLKECVNKQNMHCLSLSKPSEHYENVCKAIEYLYCVWYNWPLFLNGNSITIISDRYINWLRSFLETNLKGFLGWGNFVSKRLRHNSHYKNVRKILIDVRYAGNVTGILLRQ